MVIVLAATVQAVARLTVPWVLSSPERVANWLSATLGQRVEIDQVSAVWAGRGPWLDASGVRVAPQHGEAAINLGRVRIGIDSYALLLRNRPLIESFVLVDAQVDLERREDGRIGLRGVDMQQAAADLRALREIGQFGVSGGTVRLHLGERTLQLDQVELRFERDDQAWRGGLLKRAGEGQLHVVIAATDQGLREAYIQADAFPLHAINGLTQSFELSAIGGTLHGEGWWTTATNDGRAAFSLRDAVLTAPPFVWTDGGALAPHVRVPDGDIAIALERRDGAMIADLTVRSLGQESLASVRFAERRTTLVAERWPAAALADAALLVPALSPEIRARLYGLGGTGRIAWLRAQLGTDWQLHTVLDGFGGRGLFGGQAFALSGFDGDIAADAGGVVIRTFDDTVEAMASPMLGAPLTPRLDLLAGWHRGADPEVAALRISGEGFDIRANGSSWRDELGRPGLDLRAHVPESDIEAAPAFWILNKMPPKTVAWLNRALSTGQVKDGRVVFRGAFADWPFRAHEGRFEASFAAYDAPLHYHDEWPAAHIESADVSFIDNTMVVNALQARVFDARVSGTGSLPDLKLPILALDLAASGDGGDWLKFLEASPLKREHGEVMFGMALAGPSKVSARIDIPLKAELGKTTLSGSALAEGLQFKDAKWHLDFADLRGRIDFTHRGFAADQLRMSIDGQPAEMQIAVGEFAPDPRLAVEIGVTATTSLQTLFGHHDALTPILDVTQGLAPFTVDVSIGRSSTEHSVIRYRSNLQGIAVGFPAPIGKAAADERGFDLTVPLPTQRGAPLTLMLGDSARLFARVGNESQPFAGELQFGARRQPNLPHRGLRVSGAAPQIDIAGWAGWILRSTGDEDPILQDLDVLAGSGAEQHRLKLSKQAGVWNLGVSGEQQQGEIRFGRQDGQAVVDADFERLSIPDAGGGGRLALSPAMVPTLHLRAKSLRVGAASLGEVRIEAYPEDGGLRIERVEAKSPDLEIRANGRWTQSGLVDSSEFDIQMTSEDLGRMLTGLGYDGLIDGGQTLAKFNASWAGAPHQFALERLRGTMDVSVGQGRFLDVDPGAGRIFGLLSLRELPRRITLDFSDFFESGMSFDSIEGRFEFADGNAWTEGVSVRGPAADLLIIGRTGLASRDYDQQVMVAPRLTGVLPVIGGLAAGPVGAAAGFLAQGIVAPGNNIEAATQVHYSIGGSWEKPQVERLTPAREGRPRSG